MPNIEDLLQRAMREGKFDNLPGKGQPVRLDENPHADPEWRLAYHLLQQNGFSLPWLELRQEIENEIESARLNQRISDYNLQVPLERFQMRQLNLQQELARLCPAGH